MMKFLNAKMLIKVDENSQNKNGREPLMNHDILPRNII